MGIAVQATQNTHRLEAQAQSLNRLKDEIAKIRSKIDEGFQQINNDLTDIKNQLKELNRKLYETERSILEILGNLPFDELLQILGEIRESLKWITEDHKYNFKSILNELEDLREAVLKQLESINDVTNEIKQLLTHFINDFEEHVKPKIENFLTY